MRRARSDKQLLCHECDSLLEIDIPKKVLFISELFHILGMATMLYSAAIVLTLIQHNQRHVVLWVLLLLVPGAVGFMLYLAGKLIFLRKVKITLLIKASLSATNVFDLEGAQAHMGEDATKEQYLIQFEKLSTARLKEVLSNKRWSENARKAASELIMNKRGQIHTKN